MQSGFLISTHAIKGAWERKGDRGNVGSSRNVGGRLSIFKRAWERKGDRGRKQPAICISVADVDWGIATIS